MQKWIIGVSVMAMLLITLASAYAFATALTNLRIHTGSFSPPTVAVPMTFASESQISSSRSNLVRFKALEPSTALCRHAQTSDVNVGF
jgi:hypothetical protein